MTGRPIPALPLAPRPATFRRMTQTVLDTVTIAVNGETRRVAAGCTVAQLLETLGLDRRKVAVERNEEIVPRSTYAAVALAPGDAIEIVHFIGGG